MAADEEDAEKLVPETGFQRTMRKWRLVIYTLLLLLSSVGNQVYFKRMTSAMPNYGWFLSQLTSGAYIPFFAFFAGTNLRTASKPVLISKFAIMGLFDGFSGTLMILGGVHTSGTLQVLLAQSVIPMTIALSVALLNKSFHCVQHLGAAIIVCGIVVAKQMSGGDDSAGVNSPVFNAIFLSSMLPAALSSVFKELVFKNVDADLDINVLQFWVATFQVVTNFFAAPIYALKLLGPQQMPLSAIPAAIVGGTRCLVFMEDQVKYECGMPEEKPCDHCATAWTPVVIYMAFNMLYNIFTMLVIKHGSAALSFLVATLRMPLSSLAFSSTLIMGDEAVQPGAGDFFSLVIILAGLVTYRHGGHLLKRNLEKRPTVLVPGESPVLSPQLADSPSPSPAPRLGGSSLSQPLVERSRESRWAFRPLLSTGLPMAQPTLVLVRAPRKTPLPRSAVRMRHDLYSRLGAASPLNSPQLRHLSPQPRLPSPLPAGGSLRGRASSGGSRGAAPVDGAREDPPEMTLRVESSAPA